MQIALGGGSKKPENTNVVSNESFRLLFGFSREETDGAMTEMFTIGQELDEIISREQVKI